MSDPDLVTLKFPRQSRYYSVARLVVGGLAAPLQMSFDALDDLQLAISHLLDSDDLPAEGELTLHLKVDDDQLEASIGPFAAGSVDAAFSRGSVGPLEGNGPRDEASEFGLRRLLDSTVDEVQVDDRDGGQWVTLHKRSKAVA